MRYLRIKICGITTPADVDTTASAGADAIGINFHPGSPRSVEPAKAVDLVKAAPTSLLTIGVFVEHSFEQICTIAEELSLGGVQWYGADREGVDPFPCSLIAAFRVRNKQSLLHIDSYLAKCKSAGRIPSAILIDAFVDGQMGGTGHKAPWSLLADYNPGVPVILAGGLTPENVAEAIRIVQPEGVDVASGVESSPGRKDPDKVRRFIDAAREAAAR